jgi:integrase
MGPRQQATARKLVLSRVQVDALLSALETRDRDLAHFARVLDLTGTRPSQLARCSVQDVNLTGGALFIPSSAKGKPGTAKTPGVNYPLDAQTLRALLAGADPPTGLLFTRAERAQAAGSVGSWEATGRRVPWTKNTWTRPFREAVAAAGLPAATSIYALRHSRVVALILARVPVRVIASMLDTSVPMIERHYSRWLAAHDPSVTIVRDALAREAARADVQLVPLSGAGHVA